MNLRKLQAETVLEAMAPELTSRGEPYRYGALVFTPGEWQVVDAITAQHLTAFGWAEVREQGGVPSPG